MSDDELYNKFLAGDASAADSLILKYNGRGSGPAGSRPTSTRRRGTELSDSG